MKRHIAVLIILVGLTVAVAPALAGKGGGGSGGSGANTSPTPNIAIASINGTPMAAASVKQTPKLGDNLTFATVDGSMAGWEYPMVVVSCYQDVNGDGTIDTHLLGPDIVYSWVDHPDATFLLGAAYSIWTYRGGGPATCRADLDAYGWKQGKETIRLMASTGDWPALG